MLILCGVLGIKVGQTFIGIDQPIVSPVVLSMLGLLSTPFHKYGDVFFGDS